MFSKEDVMSYVLEEDVKFIRLAFCDITGKQKNIAIMPSELDRAFSEGIPFETQNITGFTNYVKSILYLHPDPATLSVLPWRPSNGRVVRMFCDVTYPDGTPFEADGRHILKKAIEAATAQGISCKFSAYSEFYLFKTDDNGESTYEPYDKAGYFDIAPEDKGENVRREICFTLNDMGIHPESSHHEAGPSQHEIDFQYDEPLSAAENVITYMSVVRTVAMRYGLAADFMPKPLREHSGNGMHINIAVKSTSGEDMLMPFMAGVLNHIKEMTFFLNPVEESYQRFGEKRAPIYITWSPENRSQLIMMPEVSESRRHFKLRSPDACTNPYMAFAMLIYAGLDGIEKNMDPGEPTNMDLLSHDAGLKKDFNKLPLSLKEARYEAQESQFIRNIVGDDYPFHM